MTILACIRVVIDRMGIGVPSAEVQFYGLNIEQILSPYTIEASVAVPRDATHLDAMLQHWTIK